MRATPSHDSWVTTSIPVTVGALETRGKHEGLKLTTVMREPIHVNVGTFQACQGRDAGFAGGEGGGCWERTALSIYGECNAIRG